MSQQDREKWNRKFTQMPELLAPRPPSDLVADFYLEAPGKRALDLACGGGRHVRFLSEKGFEVDAVDISAVALQKLAKEIDTTRVKLIEADLESYTPEPFHYDLIVMTNYLDRDLIERTKTALKPGGIFIIETYMTDPQNEKKDSNPAFLLARGELLERFKEGFNLLEYREFWNETYEKYRMKKQAIAVRKKREEERV
ncbi:MAG: hypothetical protein B6D59_03090 [Campylobacteraceae bacterium 4484_4]|nr:MAG: hypothetical protein B6D59_03090 [Campylobacteraceae bacterium 4484_4]